MKRLLSLLLSITLVVGIIAGVPRSADAATVYNLNTYSNSDANFGRSKETIAAEYYAALNTKTTSYYSVTPSLQSPYSGGKLSDATQSSIISMLNFYRHLSGVKQIVTPSTHSDALQAGAVIRNWDFNHSTTQSKMPADMPTDFYQLGASASHNILSSGMTPQGAMTGFLNEGYSVSTGKFGTIGHRICLLDFMTSGMQFGYAGSVEIGLRTRTAGTTNLPFVAFPPPGNVPNTMITSPNSTAWSIQTTATVGYENLSNVTATVKDLTSNTSYTCTVANGKLSSQNWGSANYILIAPPSSSSRYTHSYEVTITGLKNGATAKWTTNFFNPAEYVDSPIKTIAVNDITKLRLTQSVIDAGLSPLSSLLGSTLKVTTENGRTAVVPTASSWSVDTANMKFTNSINSSSLPSHIVSNGNNSIAVPYELVPYGRMSVNVTTVDSGGSARFTLNRYYTGTTMVTLYRLNSSGKLEVVADQDSASFSNDTTSPNVVSHFDLTNLQATDSGRYYIGYRYDWSKELFMVGPVNFTVNPDPNAPVVPSNPSNPNNPSTPSTPSTPSGSVTPSQGQTTSEGGVSGFVERLYTVALGRASDANGKAAWINAIRNGESGAEAAKGFLFSDEFLNKNMSNADFVTVLYSTFFDRQPDAAGHAAWVAALERGESKQDVIMGFINSTEWANVCLRYGILSGGTGTANITIEPNDQVIAFATRLYTTCLKRTPDQNGLRAWALQLANLRDTGTNAAHGFFFSDEMNNNPVSNEEFVTRLYLTFMDRNPDTAGFNAWVGQLNSGVSREEVFQGFAQSTEFGTICANYGIIR